MLYIKNIMKLYYTKDFEKFGCVENIGLCDMNIKFMSTKPMPKKVKKWEKTEVKEFNHGMISKDNIRSCMSLYDNLTLSIIKADLRIMARNINLDIKLTEDLWGMVINGIEYSFCNINRNKKLPETLFFTSLFDNVQNVKVFMDQVYLKIYILILLGKGFYHFLDFSLYKKTIFRNHILTKGYYESIFKINNISIIFGDLSFDSELKMKYKNNNVTN